MNCINCREQIDDEDDATVLVGRGIEYRHKTSCRK